MPLPRDELEPVEPEVFWTSRGGLFLLHKQGHVGLRSTAVISSEVDRQQGPALPSRALALCSASDEHLQRTPCCGDPRAEGGVALWSVVSDVN